MSDPKLPLYSKRCKCNRCGRYFSAPKPFDLHWRRPKDMPAAPDDGCYDPALVGLVEIDGYWQSPPMDQDARGRLPRSNQRDESENDDAHDLVPVGARQGVLL